MLIELEQNNSKTEIHHYLEQYYLKNNTILGNQFLQFYLKIYYDIQLSDKYKLHIVDNQATLFSIDNTQSILLDKDTYKII